MSVLKKLAGLILYFLIFALLVFGICEVTARIMFADHEDAIPRSVAHRLWHDWLNTENEDILLPPFRLFANKDFSPERLKRIVHDSRLPANTTLTSYDFLRPKEYKEETTYQATINNLGFRDPPRSAAKPDGTYRIIAMGSYQMFGQAIADDKTYIRQLEGMLNEAAPEGRRVEVWNGGQLSSTVIVALARITHEIASYNPDMLIIDYGFVDPAVMGDDTLPMVGYFAKDGGYGWLARLLQMTKKFIIGNSIFAERFLIYLHGQYGRNNVKNFTMAMHELCMVTKEWNIPVILLHQSVERLKIGYYKTFDNHFEHVHIVDGEEAFLNYPPTPEQEEEFFSKRHWAQEDNVDVNNSIVKGNHVYHTNLFQYNEFGHAAIARQLAGAIKPFILTTGGGGQ